MMRFLLVIITILTIQPTSSQNIPLKHIDTVNRLSNDRINVIHRDADGFIWIGTSAGLYRYDGYSFKHYTPKSSALQNSSTFNIGQIQEDSKGRLWIYSGGKYLIYDPVADKIEPDTRTVLKELGQEKPPSRIAIDQSKTIWAFTPGEGFSTISPDGVIRNVDFPDVKSVKITDIVSTPHGCLSIDSRGVIRLVDSTSLAIVRTDSLIAHENTGSKPSAYCLVYDRDGLCWIFNDSRLWLYDVNVGKWLNNLLPSDGRGQSVRSVMQDHGGQLWVGRERQGLGHIVRNDDSIHFENISDEIYATVTALYEDRDGTIWIGTSKGEIFYHHPNLNKFRFLPLPDISCILPSKTGQFAWIGDDDGLLKWHPQDNEVITVTSNRTIGSITSLLETTDGSLYIGSHADGLRRYHDNTLETIKTGTPIDNSPVTAITDASDGTLWIGTFDTGLFRLNLATHEAKQYISTNSGITSNDIMKIVPDGKGHLYIATSLGVTIFTPSTGNFAAISPLDGIGINDLIVDSRGMIWIASARGLYLYEPTRRKLTMLHLGINQTNPNLLSGLYEDNMGNIWIAEGSNLICLDIKYDTATGEISYSSHRYDSTDGLQNCHFNQRSFGMLTNGEMLVGGLRGMTTFFPEKIIDNSSLPDVIFSEIYVGNDRIDVNSKLNNRVHLTSSPNHDGRLELWPENRSFTIRFATDNYINPEKTIYLYKLEGFDPDWIRTQPGANTATYTNLDPGTYTLLVKATDADGNESQSIAEMQIVVRAPLLWSTWAKVVYILLTILIIFATYRYIIHRKRRRFTHENRTDDVTPADHEDTDSQAHHPHENEVSILNSAETSLESSLQTGTDTTITDTDDKESQKSIKNVPPDEKMVGKVTNYILENINRPELSVEELSNHLGISRVHLYKKIKATTGRTPIEYIRMIRMKQAARMLRENRMNISEIAFQLGYNNPKYFSRYFKEEFGVSPSAYQERESHDDKSGQKN